MELIKESEIITKNKHLPVIGVGSILCFPMILISIIAIFLSIKGVIPYAVINRLQIPVKRCAHSEIGGAAIPM